MTTDTTDTTKEDTLATFKANHTSFPSTKLCEIIATHQFLGCLKAEAILCMKELAKRRYMGDDFLFEAYIDEKVAYLRGIK